MYKILIKLETKHPYIYNFYTVKNPEGKNIEYSTDSLDDAKNTALLLMDVLGYGRIKVVEDKPYYLNVLADGICEDFTEEEKNDVLKALEYTGRKELILAKNSDYTIELVWGIRPERLIPVYDVTFEGENVSFEHDIIEGVVENNTIENIITFNDNVKAFHLKVQYDDITTEFTTGLPDWIHYIPLTPTQGKLILNGINKDYKITVIID